MLDCKKDNWRTELVLSFYRRGECGKTRAKQWEKHVRIYAAIKDPEHQAEILKTGTPKYWKETRVKFLIEHLDILDRKLGMLLQFLALLATAMGLALARLIANGEWGPCWFQSLACAIAIFWFVGIFLCLFGVRRLEWGDLGEDASVPAAEMSETDLTNAEQKFVNKIISEVIRRTAKFRVAIYSTLASVIFFLLLCVLAIAFPFSGRAAKDAQINERIPASYVVNAPYNYSQNASSKPDWPKRKSASSARKDCPCDKQP